jgi:hypothetical protein
MGKAKVTKKFSAPEWVVGVMGIVGTLGSFEHSARSRYLLYGVLSDGAARRAFILRGPTWWLCLRFASSVNL